MTDEGVGCRTALFSVLIALGLAAVWFTAGLVLTLDQGCAGACATTGLALYSAGAPISGLFSALAGGLPVAWPVDVTLWVVAGFLAARYSERRAWPLWRAPAAIGVVALLYGLIISTFIERA